MDYKELLTRGRSKLPESVLSKERFEVPKIRGHIQGNKTVLSNFYQIADMLSRESDHMLKFVLKELATPGEEKKPLVLLGRKVSATTINEKIELYYKRYVLCKECNRPDTGLVRQERQKFIKCNACGAKYPVN